MTESNAITDDQVQEPVTVPAKIISDQEPVFDAVQILVTTEIATLKAITVCDTDETLQSLVVTTKKTKKLITSVETARKGVTVRIDAIKTHYMDIERSIVNPIKTELNRVNTLASNYTAAKEREAEAQQLELQRQARQAALDVQNAEIARLKKEKEDADAAATAATAFGSPTQPLYQPSAPPPAPIAPVMRAWNVPLVKTKVGGVTVRETLTGSVIYPTLVPRELCSPDPRKINDSIKNLKNTGMTTDQIRAKMQSMGIQLDIKTTAY